VNPLELECRWNFADADFDADDDLVALGADLEPATIVGAYSQGVFPMGLGEGGGEPLGWWSPLERGVLRRGDFHVSRSLRRSGRTMEVSIDTAFDDVVAGCADPSRDGAWITPAVASAYGALHRLGVAHSIEVRQDGELVGGLYGLALGGLFAGESKFHVATDASKVALWALSEVVFAEPGPRLIDVQWRTDHLASLGITTMERPAYRDAVAHLVTSPPITGLVPGARVPLGNR